MFFKYKHILAVIVALSIAGAVWGKKAPGVRVDSARIETSPAAAPLSPKWDVRWGIIARWYPQSALSEEQFFAMDLRRFGILNGDSQLELAKERETDTGLQKRFRQLYKGLVVKGAELLLSFNADDEIVSVFNNLLPIENLDLFPTLPFERSREIAFEGIEDKTLRAPGQGFLTIAEIEGEPKLVYEWRIPASQPYGDWEILIDAQTGEILSKKDLRIFSVTGSGRVFDPDPKTAIESDTLTDQGDSNAAIPEECYTEVDLLELDDAIGGIYTLSGPYANTEPTANRAQESSPDFLYLREDDRFEEVCTYYHLDTYQRYIQSLGFDDIANYSQSCNVNGTTEDNSCFSPLTGIITYGSGGVDDAEDADVILHEYGHAIQWDILPGWSGGHTGAMGEGFSDYIAGTYSLVINPTFHPEWVFTWDGHNQFWAGRVLNAPYHYPENAGGEIHDSGQLWSAGLIDVWYDVPDVEIWDKIVFQHHFYLGNGASMEDAANAILLADIEVNFGDYRDIIIDNFLERGFLNPLYVAPVIEHQPLMDTEDTLATEFSVSAVITSMQPLDTTSFTLFWGVDGWINQYLPLARVEGDTFAAEIPGPFNYQTVSYYIFAADSFGVASYSPPEAPGEVNSFFVGPDTIPPTLVFYDTIPNTIFPNGYGEISVIASDNLGLAEVTFNYCPQGMNYESIEMTQAGGDTFTADFAWSNLNMSEHYYYYISATDNSGLENTTSTPELSFSRSTTATFDDFEKGLSNWISSGDWQLQNTRFYSPVTAARDRNEFGIPSADTLTLTLKNPWTPAGLTDLHLEYWTSYFMVPQNDTGYVEINYGEGWMALDTVSGSEGYWEKHVIPLGDYIQYDSLSVRFRTLADTSYPNSTLGWYIDDIILSADPVVETEGRYSAKQEYGFSILEINPNPGNADFSFVFYIPNEGRVKATIYNILGRKVATVADRVFPRGLNQIKWLGNFSTGLYFIELKYANESRMEKFLLLR